MPGSPYNSIFRSYHPCPALYRKVCHTLYSATGQSSLYSINNTKSSMTSSSKRKYFSQYRAISNRSRRGGGGLCPGQRIGVEREREEGEGGGGRGIPPEYPILICALILAVKECHISVNNNVLAWCRKYFLFSLPQMTDIGEKTSVFFRKEQNDIP